MSARSTTSQSIEFAERAAVSGLKAGVVHVRPRTLNLIKQFPSRDADKLLAANLTQNDTLGAAL
jgi:hypothetical protein